MKLKILSLAILFSVPSFSYAQVMDFKASVEMALAQNPEMQVSDFRMQQAESALKASKAARLPQITASMTASSSDNALNVFGMKLQQREVVQADFIPRDLNNPASHNDFNTRIEMLLPIWNGGKITASQNQARAMLQATRYGDEAVQQFLTFHVYQAYEGVHTARRYIEVAKKGVEASESYVKTTQDLMDQGLVVRSELLTAQVSLSKAKISLEQAKNEEQLALDGLRVLLNMDAGEPLEIGPKHVIKLPQGSLEELSQLAITQNPELDAKRHQAQSALNSVDVVRAEIYPSFNVMARNDWHDDGFGIDSSSYTVAAVMSWKLTDFGVTDSKIARANAAASEKRAALRAKENQVRLDILTSWRNLQLNKQQAKVQKATIEQASEAQRLVMRRYENGLATMTEVLNSHVMLDKVRADLVKTEFKANMYKAKLRLATGTMSIAEL